MAAAKKALVENFTRIGNPTIVNGILTPSSTSWIQTPTPFDPGTYSWKIVFKITRNNESGYQNLLSSPYIMLQADGWKGKLYLKEKNTTSWTSISNGAIQTPIGQNATWFIKIEYDGVSTYSIGRSADGITYSNIQSLTSSKKVGSGFITFGSKASNTSAVNAEYDLLNTKIWINGEVVWTPYK